MNIPAAGWIREKALLASGSIPFSRTKLRAEVEAGRFPRPHVFAPRVVAYDCEAVHAWIAAQRVMAPPVAPRSAAPQKHRALALATP
jgi:hypothetical protein